MHIVERIAFPRMKMPFSDATGLRPQASAPPVNLKFFEVVGRTSSGCKARVVLAGGHQKCQRLS
jgi:hypothetical protein